MKIFGKWEMEGLECRDLGIAKYMSLKGKSVPHTFGADKRSSLDKSKVNVVERLINKMMRSGQGKKKLSGKFLRCRNGCGKKENMIKSVELAFDHIAKTTKENPVQVLIKAIENSAPREDTIRIQRGGITTTQAVDVAPLKRLDEALKNIALASFKNTFRSDKEIYMSLAEEIVTAAANDMKSYAVKRRDEIERIAQGSR